MKIIIHSGMTVQYQCGQQLHPYTEVQKAKTLVDKTVNLLMNSDNSSELEDIIIYSNSPDFIQFIHYYSQSKNINIEFTLDDISKGNDIEAIFEDFNKSYLLMERYIDEDITN